MEPPPELTSYLIGLTIDLPASRPPSLPASPDLATHLRQGRGIESCRSIGTSTVRSNCTTSGLVRTSCTAVYARPKRCQARRFDGVAHLFGAQIHVGVGSGRYVDQLIELTTCAAAHGGYWVPLVGAGADTPVRDPGSPMSPAICFYAPPGHMAAHWGRGGVSPVQHLDHAVAAAADEEAERACAEAFELLEPTVRSKPSTRRPRAGWSDRLQ